MIIPVDTGRTRGVLVLAAGDFDQVIAKLSLYRALHDIDGSAENDLVEFTDHLARTERAQIAAVAAGRAAGMLFCHLGEIGAVLDGCFKFLTLFFSRNKDMTCRGLSHKKYSVLIEDV